MTLNRMRFPQMVALTAFVLYVLTLSRGMTLGSLTLTAKVAGWDWLPMSTRPLTWLLTLPFHLLPASWVPIALNLFSAAFAAMTLGLLARCVELLPWDLAPDAKKPWIARLPALLAVAMCGFELSFWQEATAATGEMTDIFLLAAAIRFLLEYRAGKEPREMRWLTLAAVTWGLGMAENWVMLVTLPLFVAALIALRGLRFFQRDFVLRMALLGLAGFSIYALLPLANWLEPHSPWKFTEAWQATLFPTKNLIHALYNNFWSWHRLLAFAVGLYFLVPTLPCFVHLQSQTANVSPIDRFQIWLYQLLRMALLLACLWLAFDPEVGPRAIIRQQLGFTLPLLTFDFINAVGIAFIIGNLLFAAQQPPQRRARTSLEKFGAQVQRHAGSLVIGLSLLVIACLVARNLPALLLTNRRPVTDFGELMARSLPSGDGIVLGDDPTKLTLMQAALASRGESRHWQVLNLIFLPDPQYRAAQERQFPTGWLAIGATNELEPNETLQLLDGIARTNRLFFLQPHSGRPLFERFQPVPMGAVAELKIYPQNRFAGAPLPTQQIDELEKFWDEAWSSRLAGMSQPKLRPSYMDRLLKKRLALQPVRHEDSLQLGRWYSSVLNDWGVTLQENGRLAGAKYRFEQALALNTNNMSAYANLNCCTNLLVGNPLNLSGAAQVVERFRNIQQLGQLISVCGELDDPGTRCVLGNAWMAAGWPRQAWLEFDRAHVLAPASVTPQLALAHIYSRYRFDAEVFATVRQLRPLVTNTPAGNSLELELAMLEAKSWISQTNAARANKILDALLQAHPDDTAFTEMVFKAYLDFGEMSNALQMAEAQLARSPDSIAALNNKAALLIQSKNSAAAIPVLDRALTLTNLPSIRLNRAIAYLQVTNTDAAEQDYKLLENSTADPFIVHFGLAQVALNRHDTNSAVQYLGLCLSNAPSGSPAWQTARSQLDSLRH